MPYTAEKPPLSEPIESLRARIPGWGADLDPRDRPSVPRLQPGLRVAGAHWEIPEQQLEKWPRERSIEHARLTPVFGTSCPPKGLSGVIRKLAYRRYSEARAAHWLLLIAADRVDAVESHVRSFATLRPDNPLTQSGLRAELTRGGVRSRFGKRRADVALQALDPLVVAAPWLVGGGLLVRAIRKRPRVHATRRRDVVSGPR